MVTSHKQPDKKVVKMAEHTSVAVVPQRTLLGEVNEHITCPLCRGYYIDATTIVECLHSFCRSCIIKHLNVKSYCPVCEMMINSAKPNIKLDKALQDIVYKLVPGLFQKEMERRQQFYASRPGPAASATPEQRGEDTERIIFSPEDVISFSLEYADVTDADSISSKSSDSNDPQPTTATTRRYLQCPAVVNISHLKKFISMKFDIDSTQFAIDILYKRVPLPDYYTLMDIAYIYNWKRNEPMRFFYQITDYVAIRNRLFEINRKDTSSCNFPDRKTSPATTEDTNASSPTPHLNDQGSEPSSGTDSPMLDDNVKQVKDALEKNKKPIESQNKDKAENTDNASMSPKKNDEDVEKSQFLNSFELTPKSCIPVKSSPVKTSPIKSPPVKSPNEKSSSHQSNDPLPKSQINPLKLEDKVIEPSKRKLQATTHTPELKKLKIELEKTKINDLMNSPSVSNAMSSHQNNKITEHSPKPKEHEGISKIPQLSLPVSTSVPVKDIKPVAGTKHLESPGVKRTVSGPPNISSPKRKPQTEGTSPLQVSLGASKPISPLKLQMPKTDSQLQSIKPEVQKAPTKKMPDLKPGIPTSQSSQNKGQTVNKVRMDLLANNSDPTIDRSKILSQVKTSLGAPNAVAQQSGDPLKSLFDSCKINIPSSLSITLTDQKLDPRNPGDVINSDGKKNKVNKNLAVVGNSAHKVPSPPVYNYIEILKLPEAETKNQQTEANPDPKSNTSNKPQSTPVQSKPPGKSSENSAKGPVPNLKPISDTKLAKLAGNFAAPITFQQTFEQQLQSLQTDKKSKLPKNKAQVPKLVPATPKSLNAVNKPNNSTNKPNPGNMPSLENKTGTALDLSTPHNQNQLGQQQALHKAFETMQSIDNLAKKQNLPAKSMPPIIPPAINQNNVFPNSIANRPLPTGISPLRIPSANSMNQMKLDKMTAGGSQLINNRQEMSNNKNPNKPINNANITITSPGYQITPHMSPSTAQPRPQTRSPSSSPKLVIAEEKQSNTSTTEHTHQSNQISSTQISNANSPNDILKPVAGPSKPGLKPMPPAGKFLGIRQPITPTSKLNPTMNFSTDYMMSQARPQLMSHHHATLLKQQMDMSAWLKSRQFDLFANMAHQAQNDFNNKE